MHRPHRCLGWAAVLVALAVGGVRAQDREPAPPAVADPTLWNRLGGLSAVKVIVHDFVARVATDPRVDFARGGPYALDPDGVAELEQGFVHFLSAAAGGTLPYSRRP